MVKSDQTELAQVSSKGTPPMKKLPTGEPYAGKPPVRFGRRGGESLPYPIGLFFNLTTVKLLLESNANTLYVNNECR